MINVPARASQLRLLGFGQLPFQLCVFLLRPLGVASRVVSLRYGDVSRGLGLYCFKLSGLLGFFGLVEFLLCLFELGF